jgi:hypothetical protein
VIRKTLKIVGAVLFAIFALASISEAAPNKAVRHRSRHSSRVSVGGSRTARKRTSTQARGRKGRGPSSATSSKARRKTTKPR